MVRADVEHALLSRLNAFGELAHDMDVWLSVFVALEAHSGPCDILNEPQGVNDCVMLKVTVRIRQKRSV